MLYRQRAVTCGCSPWKTSTFQKLTAARKPRVVITYSIIGIQGLIRLAMRRPRGEEYEGDIEDAEERDGDAQLEAMGQGAGENGCWREDVRGWWVRCERIQGGMEEIGEDV